MEYLNFEAERLYDFNNVILPDIYQQLLAVPNFDDAGIVCIGALEDRKAAGAIVAGYTDENTLAVLSLYVRPSKRDRGTGSELISRLIGHVLAAKEYRGSTIAIGIRMEYTVELANEARFLQFLVRNHFTDRSDMGKVYVIPAEVCRNYSGGASVKTASLSALPGDGALDAAAFFREIGINADPEYCFITGDPRNPDGILAAEYGSGQDFYICSAALNKKLSAEAYRAMLSRAVRTIAKENPEFVLIAEDVRNVYPKILKELSADGGEVYAHGMAAFRAEFRSQ